MISAKGGEVKIVLGIDRLDYTKGLTNRLLAFERLLDKYPAHIGKVMLLQASFLYVHTLTKSPNSIRFESLKTHPSVIGSQKISGLWILMWIYVRVSLSNIGKFCGFFAS